MQKLDNIVFRGYSKKENGHYVAVCIDLNIVAQGDTPEIAIKECSELIQQYVKYICDEYPDRFSEFIPRYAPQELIDEYDRIVSNKIKPKLKLSRQRASYTIHNFDFQPENMCLAAV